MSELWATLIAVGLPMAAGAIGGLARYTSLRARALRTIDDEIATLNSLPPDLPSYGEMEVVVRRHVSEYARAVTGSRRMPGGFDARSMNLGVLIGLVCTVGGATATSYFVGQLGEGVNVSMNIAGLLPCVFGTAFGVLMLTLVLLGALSRASSIAWVALTAEDTEDGGVARDDLPAHGSDHLTASSDVSRSER